MPATADLAVAGVADSDAVAKPETETVAINGTAAQSYGSVWICRLGLLHRRGDAHHRLRKGCCASDRGNGEGLLGEVEAFVLEGLEGGLGGLLLGLTFAPTGALTVRNTLDEGLDLELTGVVGAARLHDPVLG